MQLSSELSGVKARLQEQQNVHGASALIQKEHSLRNTSTGATKSFANLHARRISGGEEGQSEKFKENESDGDVQNDTNYGKNFDNIYVVCDNDESDCDDIGGGDHAHNHIDDNIEGAIENEGECDGDDDGNAEDDDDNDDNNDKSECSDINGVDHDHDDHPNHDNVDDNIEGAIGNEGVCDGDDDGNAEHDDDNDDGGGGDKDENDDDQNNSNRDDNNMEGACYSPTADEDVSKESYMDARYEPQNSTFGLHVSNSKNKVNRSTENVASRSNKITDDETLQESGGKTNFNSQNVPLPSNATNLNQGARPKTSSQRIPQDNMANRRCYYNSRIPSLEVTGITDGFLARHTTDTSLPHASNPSDFNLSAETGSFALGHPVSSRSSNNSDMLWSLPPPPDQERQMLRRQHPYANGLQHVDVGHQATTPMMSLRSDWQLSHQPQPERNASYIPRKEQWLLNRTDPRTAHQQQSLVPNSLQRNFTGATTTQDVHSSNRHGWMSSSYESNWHYPRTDLRSSGINTSRFAWNEPVLTLPAVKSRAHAIIPPSVTLPETQPQSTLSNVASSVSSNDFSGLNGNGKEWLDYSTGLRQNISQNQENRRFTSSEMSSSRREELRSSNSRSQEVSLAPGTSQQGSLASNATDDYTLAALERKVAEACAVVERVMKERDERVKAKREAAQREREIRERNEREAREREARERSEREAREREERERREREARERVERERREREARETIERRRNEEREGGERERRAARERAPVQESLRWQCQHYQRRCKVSFPCCGVFYPCHRCHNESGACDADDMKATHATHVKCSNCGHEEEVSNVMRILFTSPLKFLSKVIKPSANH